MGISFKKRLLDAWSKSYDEFLLVNVGGGDAGDLGVLRKALREEVKERLVLFELEHIVDRSEQNGLEAVVGDWNVRQPIERSSFSPCFFFSEPKM